MAVKASLIFCFLAFVGIISVAYGQSDLVSSLPLIGKLPFRTLAGYLPVDTQNNGSLFYLFFESQNKPSTDPLVLWLQGGPGCSSLFGCFVENGPFLIQQNGSFVSNPYSWNAKANVIYIDQPVGTGFSYVNNPTGYVTSEKEVAQELYTALVEFFTLHPEYSKNPFWVFGESYGGKYIPSICHYILEQNQKDTAAVKINLSGLGIGDGWVNPYYQTGSYAPFLYQNGLIGEGAVAYAEATYQVYKAFSDLELWIAAEEVGNILLETLVLDAGNVDVYDIRYFGGDPTDPLQDALANYLNRPDVLEAIHAGSDGSWQACDGAGFGLLEDEEQSVENLMPDLLANYPVLNYNGNKDLICNYLGTIEWQKHIGWPGQSTFDHAKNQTYYVNGKPAGYYKTGGGLTHVVINDASHMVPFNQPQNSQDMLYRFIAGGFKESL